MKFTLKRLMLWVIMGGSLSYLALGPQPENAFGNFLVAATVAISVFFTARQHPLGALIAGFVFLNLLPLTRDEQDAMSYSIWGAYGACFLGAFLSSARI